MKLRWRKTRTHKGVEYGKWILHPPVEAMEKLGWKDGDELDTKIQGDALLVRPKKKGK